MRTEIIFLILGMALVTYFTRFFFLAIFKNTIFPERLQKWLKYMPISILTVLIVPSILAPTGTLDISWHNDYFIAALVSIVISYKTQNILWTIGAGMGIIFFIRFIW